MDLPDLSHINIVPPRHVHTVMMDSVDNLHHTVDTMALNDNTAPESSAGQKDTSPSEILRLLPHI